MLLYFYYLLKEIAGGSWDNKYIILFGVVINISATNENTITHQIILLYNFLYNLYQPNFCELFGPYLFNAWFTLLMIWTLKSYPSLRRKHSLYVCFANSLVGLNITALNPFLFGPHKWWIMGIRNAAVFPDPVGAHANICLP